MEGNTLKYYVLVEGGDKASSIFKLVGNAAKQAEKAVSGVGSGSDSASKSIKDLTSSTEQNTNATNRASSAQRNWFAHITRTTIQSALVNKAFLAITDSIGAAVKQADLIATFPSSMQALGQSTSEASESFTKLQAYVQKTGGDISTATNAVSRFVAVNKDVQASTAVYAGVSNALLAGGTSAETQASAMEQLIQAYSRGKFEGEEWRSVNTAMSLAIQETANALGYVSTSSLQTALTDGKVSMNEFITELTRISTEAGPVADQVALKMTGIEFATTSMKNAITNGLAQIYMAVGRQNIVAFFTILTQTIGILFKWIVNLINIFVSLFNLLTGNNMSGITGDTAQNLQDGAGAASDMANGLDDAGKSAKKLRNQLASFDKMNVLTEPTDDSGSSSPGGGAGTFTAGQTEMLDNIFADMTVGAQEASKWAKILAGIIAGIMIWKTVKFLWTLGGGILEGLKALRMGLGLIPTDTALAETGMFKFGKSIISLVTNPIFWVIAAIALLVAGIVILYNTNEDFKRGFDKVWSGVLKVLGDVYNWIAEKMTPIIESLSKAWEDFLINTGLKQFADDISKLAKQFSDWVIEITGVTNGMELLGVIAGILAVLVGVGLVVAFVAWLVPLALVAIKLIIIVAIIALFVAAVVLIGIALFELGKIIVNVLVAAWDILVGVFNGLISFFAGLIQGIINTVVSIWNGIVSVLTVPFQVAWNIIKGIFILLVAIIAITLETIFNILSGIATWLWNNVLAPVINLVSSLVGSIINFVVSMWNGIMSILGSIWDWINSKVIQPVANIFSGLWNGVSKGVSDAIEMVKAVLGSLWSWINSNVIQPVANIFSGLWNGITTGVNNMIEGIKNIFNSIINMVKVPFNIIIDGINGVIKSINSIKVPDWVPGLGGASTNFPTIPRLATGGVVEQPTIAMVGEAGAEAVMPLENNTGWIDQLASKLNTNTSSNQTSDIIPVTNNKEQSPTVININLSGIVATSEQDKRKLGDMISKQIEKSLKAKGVKVGV